MESKGSTLLTSLQVMQTEWPTNHTEASLDFCLTPEFKLPVIYALGVRFMSYPPAVTDTWLDSSCIISVPSSTVPNNNFPRDLSSCS